MSKGVILIKVINMIDDFELLCKEAEVIGNFEAYKHYPVLFEGIFRGLYMTEIDNLKDMINHVDFERNLKFVQDNENRSITAGIIKEVEKVVSLLKFNKDFDLYLGMELGNIGGFSAPNPNGKPFIYIGLDRKIDETFIMYFVSHEMNHMIRADAVKEINLFDFMERVITERLGSYCPVELYKMEYSLQAIACSLNLSIEEVRRLRLNKDLLIRKLSGEFGKLLTQEKMRTYFTWSDADEQPHLRGYYVGMEIVKQLVDAGYDLAQLTVMPSQQVWKEFSAICLTNK